MLREGVMPMTTTKCIYDNDHSNDIDKVTPSATLHLRPARLWSKTDKNPDGIEVNFTTDVIRQRNHWFRQVQLAPSNRALFRDASRNRFQSDGREQSTNFKWRLPHETTRSLREYPDKESTISLFLTVLVCQMDSIHGKMALLCSDVPGLVFSVSLDV